jgi:N-acyl-D-amino-acid deacylase
LAVTEVERTLSGMRRLFVLLAALGVTLSAQSAPLDIAIVNIGDGGGRVFTGAADAGASVKAIGIRNGRIVAIGPTREVDAKNARLVIDATGLTVTPGFIDVHSHGLETLGRPELRNADAELAQGVTTIVGNPDGGGPVDLAKQRATLEGSGGIGVNVALLIGHGSVRSAVMGGANRAPTADELAKMVALVKQAVADGAFGMSSGIFYTPGRYAKTDELVALAHAAGGVYTSHIRDEGNYDVGVVASVDEVIRVAEQAKVTGIVSHMKALGPDSWGLSTTLIAHIDAARKRGVSVFADQYPYDASSTSLAAAVLPGVSVADARARLADAAKKPALLAAAKENIRRRGGAHSIAIASTRDSTLNGKRLDDIATSKGVSAEQQAIDIILDGGASIVSFNMREDDIRAIMKQPWTMTSSDGGLSLPGAGVPHPRNNGAFARKFNVYVRGQVITLDQALTSMTSLPAKVFGFTDLGELRVGAAADIAIFDPSKVVDRATYENPHQLATGMSWVLVNGQVAWKDGKGTGARAGQVLRRP